jgi:hypothetical protein
MNVDELQQKNLPRKILFDDIIHRFIIISTPPNLRCCFSKICK